MSNLSALDMLIAASVASYTVSEDKAPKAPKAPKYVADEAGEAFGKHGKKSG